jgi:hypothetical protein
LLWPVSFGAPSTCLQRLTAADASDVGRARGSAGSGANAAAGDVRGESPSVRAHAHTDTQTRTQTQRHTDTCTFRIMQTLQHLQLLCSLATSIVVCVLQGPLHTFQFQPPAHLIPPPRPRFMLMLSPLQMRWARTLTHTVTHTYTTSLALNPSLSLDLHCSPAGSYVCVCRLLIRMGMEETKRIELGFFRTEDDVRRETDKHVA